MLPFDHSWFHAVACHFKCFFLPFSYKHLWHSFVSFCSMAFFIACSSWCLLEVFITPPFHLPNFFSFFFCSYFLKPSLCSPSSWADCEKNRSMHGGTLCMYVHNSRSSALVRERKYMRAQIFLTNNSHVRRDQNDNSSSCTKACMPPIHNACTSCWQCSRKLNWIPAALLNLPTENVTYPWQCSP